MTQAVWIKPEPDEAAVKEYYGLDPQEWTGSTTDKVMRILDKNEPERDRYANALLRDECIVLVQGVEYCHDINGAGSTELTNRSSAEEMSLILDDGTDLRSAIMEASLGGVLFEDETQEAMKRADWAHTDAMRDAEWYDHSSEIREALDEAHGSFTKMRDEVRKVTEARLYYRSVEESKQQARQAQVGHNREPVPIGDVLKEWLHSMGRDELGQPLSHAQFGDHGDGFDASLPGSEVALGRSPDVLQQTSARVVSEIPSQEQSQSMSIDDEPEF